MKKLYALATALTLSAAPLFAAQHLVSAIGFQYNPEMVMANVGDTINFELSFSLHPTVEVDQATWNRNDATPLSGGFSFTSGSTGSIVVTAPGDRYFVCSNHVGSGMKGMIMVSGATAVKPEALLAAALAPNPCVGEVILPSGSETEASILQNGRLIRREALAGRRVLSVADLPPGVYTLLLGKKAHRFVKE